MNNIINAPTKRNTDACDRICIQAMLLTASTEGLFIALIVLARMAVSA